MVGSEPAAHTVAAIFGDATQQWPLLESQRRLGDACTRRDQNLSGQRQRGKDAAVADLACHLMMFPPHTTEGESYGGDHRGGWTWGQQVGGLWYIESVTASLSL